MKEFLRQRQISFEAVDVSQSPDAVDRIRERTGGAVGTPTVVIDGEARIGFDPEWMHAKLHLGSGQPETDEPRVAKYPAPTPNQ